jgi:hypothetical protein
MRDNQYGKQAGLRGFEGTNHATITCNMHVLLNVYLDNYSSANLHTFVTQKHQLTVSRRFALHALAGLQIMTKKLITI